MSNLNRHLNIVWGNVDKHERIEYENELKQTTYVHCAMLTSMYASNMKTNQNKQLTFSHDNNMFHEWDIFYMHHLLSCVDMYLQTTLTGPQQARTINGHTFHALMSHCRESY